MAVREVANRKMTVQKFLLRLRLQYPRSIRISVNLAQTHS